MLFRLLDRLLPSEPADIPLTCQRPLAVKRLKKHLSPGISALFKLDSPGGVAGRVTLQHVRLHYIYGKTAGWTKSNAWQPWLRASFENVNGQVHLRGRFEIHPFVQRFSGIWLGGVLFIALFSFWLFLNGPTAGRDDPVPLLFPIGALAFFFCGLGLMHAAWRWSEDDIDAITRYIDEHAGADASYDDTSDNTD